MTIELYDLSARMVKQFFEGTLNKDNNLFNAVNVKELKSGMYLLKAKQPFIPRPLLNNHDLPLSSIKEGQGKSYP